MKIAVIMLHFGALTTTHDSLKNLTPKLAGHRLILVNNTTDDISALVKIIPGTALIDNRRNLGFAAGGNQGIKLALQDPSITHFFLLNNDTFEQGVCRPGFFSVQCVIQKIGHCCSSKH